MSNYLYIVLTVLFTVYGQIVVKWQMNNVGVVPAGILDKAAFLFGQLFNPWIISVFFAAFLAALSWMIAMTKFELSYAFPFTSATFVCVLLSGGIFFHEAITWPKIVGVLLIVLGVVVSSRF